MAVSQTRVVIKVDTSRWEAAMRDLARSLGLVAARRQAHLRRLATRRGGRNHRVEAPARSAMHARYDQRRRARRRRNRR